MFVERITAHSGRTVKVGDDYVKEEVSVEAVLMDGEAPSPQAISDTVAHVQQLASDAVKSQIDAARGVHTEFQQMIAPEPDFQPSGQSGGWNQGQSQPQSSPQTSGNTGTVTVDGRTVSVEHGFNDRGEFWKLSCPVHNRMCFANAKWDKVQTTCKNGDTYTNFSIPEAAARSVVQ